MLIKTVNETLNDFSEINKRPRSAVLTDDPLRAKMLCAHHLENAVAVQEQGDALEYRGSYKNVSIVLISAGFGVDALLSSLNKIKQLGAKEIIYIGECVSSARQYALRSVILADGGDHGLMTRARLAASQYTIPVSVCSILTYGSEPPDFSGIADSATNALYERSREYGLAALSVITVSENTEAEERMEEHERSSRFYAAARLVFETLAISS